jgi:hypothetical protein
MTTKNITLAEVRRMAIGLLAQQPAARVAQIINDRWHTRFTATSILDLASQS